MSSPVGTVGTGGCFLGRCPGPSCVRVFCGRQVAAGGCAGSCGATGLGELGRREGMVPAISVTPSSAPSLSDGSPQVSLGLQEHSQARGTSGSILAHVRAGCSQLELSQMYVETGSHGANSHILVWLEPRVTVYA